MLSYLDHTHTLTHSQQMENGHSPHTIPPELGQFCPYCSKSNLQIMYIQMSYSKSGRGNCPGGKFPTLQQMKWLNDDASALYHLVSH